MNEDADALGLMLVSFLCGVGFGIIVVALAK